MESPARPPQEGDAEDPEIEAPRSQFVGRVLDFFQRVLPLRPHYEQRSQQLEMALRVARALEDEEVLVAEAGTGTGKSLAYLIPALLWAQSRGGPIIVSTRTLNLQQQLLEHDLPLLEGLFSSPFRAAPARGWSNYVCLRRLEALPGSGLVEEWVEREAIQLQSRLRLGAPGIRQKLEVGEALWSQIAAESSACNRQACPHFNECYLFQERRLLERADVIVTNHSLVMADLSLRRQGATGILPRPQGLVLDEAHHLEEVANEHLSRSLSQSGLERMKEQLYRPKARFEEGGLLPAVRAYLAQARLYGETRSELLQLVDRELLARLPDFYGAGENFFYELSAFIQRSETSSGVVRVGVTRDALDSLRGAALKESGGRFYALAEALQGALTTLSRRLAEEFTEQGGGLLQEVTSSAQQMGSLRADLEFCLFPEDPNWVYWALESPHDCVLGATPLDVGELLAQELLTPTRSLVLTSATLASREGNFEYFEQRSGLIHVPDRVSRMCVASPFDYAQQAYLGVATDLPDPNQAQFFEKIEEPLAELIGALGGRTFLLLTSYSALRKAAQILAPHMQEYGIEMLRQGEAPNGHLLERFRRDQRCVLLGTDSFWEGVDVPGDALQCVVMARLPFRVPSDPIVEAHCRRLEEEGRSPFRDYQLPQAVLRFRQGFGRLVRTQRDRGMVLVLDSRLYHRDYGKDFLSGVPQCTRRAGSLRRVVADALSWLGSG